MRILHIVPGLEDPTNGIAVAAKLIAQSQSADIIDARQFCRGRSDFLRQNDYSEIWVHSMWLPQTMLACWRVLRNVRMFECSECSKERRPKLVRMVHANLDPLRYRYHGWKKRLVAPIERWLFKHTDRVVVTCEAEKKWCQEWGLENEFQILDLKRFFRLDESKSKAEGEQRNLHVLYLGRRHPLKGVEFLEQAVRELDEVGSRSRTVELRIVSDHFGAELEKDWGWCDVLVLPTLSENFGLVVAEALERGKMVITTDGAPAWGEGGMFECSECSNVRMGYGGRLVYLRGYRDGTAAERVRLLKDAIMGLVD